MNKTLKERNIERKLKNITSQEVSYKPEEKTISISKGKIHINLAAEFCQATPNEKNCNGYIMEISGNPIVINPTIVRAIWEALWETPITKIPDTDVDICFKDVKPVSDPNYVPMHIELLMPTVYH